MEAHTRVAPEANHNAGPDVWFTAQAHNDGHKLQGPFTVTLAVKTWAPARAVSSE